MAERTASAAVRAGARARARGARAARAEKAAEKEKAKVRWENILWRRRCRCYNERASQLRLQMLVRLAGVV